MDGARAAGDAVPPPDDGRTHAAVADAVGGAGWNGGTGRKPEAGATSAAAATRNGAAATANEADSERKTTDGATAINATATATNATETATDAIATAINATATAAPTDDASDATDATAHHDERWRSGAAAAASNGGMAAIRDGRRVTAECAAGWAELFG